jgi:hypothetical protein
MSKSEKWAYFFIGGIGFTGGAVWRENWTVARKFLNSSEGMGDVRTPPGGAGIHPRGCCEAHPASSTCRMEREYIRKLYLETISLEQPSSEQEMGKCFR